MLNMPPLGAPEAIRIGSRTDTLGNSASATSRRILGTPADRKLDRIGNAWDTRLRALKSLAESAD